MKNTIMQNYIYNIYLQSDLNFILHILMRILLCLYVYMYYIYIYKHIHEYV